MTPTSPKTMKTMAMASPGNGNRNGHKSAISCIWLPKCLPNRRTCAYCVTPSIMGGVLLGLLLSHYGYVFENIRVEVRVAMYDNALDDWIFIPKQSEVAQPHLDYVVPNIVHFIWYGKDKKMSFVNYVSIKSAYVIQRPGALYLHYDYEPVGEWWDKLKQEIPIKMVQRTPPKTIHGQTLLHAYHKGDITKLEVLMKYGGIYLDYDVIMIQPLDPLRVYDATLGKEKPPKFIAGIILARNESLFLKLWHESYRDNYRAFDWDYNCARVTYQLYKERPDLLHVEPYRFTTPDWTERHKLWNDIINWRDLYVIHIMSHLSWTEYEPDNIKSLNSTFGEVMRNIYYGSPALRK